MTVVSYDARWLQRALQSLGFYAGLIDGIVGPQTNTAIVAFKQSAGLRARPYVGPKTLAALRERAGGLAGDLAGERAGDLGGDLAGDLGVPADAGGNAGQAFPMPPWIVEINKALGLHEDRDNTALRAWLKSDGATLGDPAQLPWCGDAAATALRLALPDEPFPDNLERNPYWARNFAQFGVKCGHVYGAVASFKRGKGGHVGFVVGYDPDRRRLLIRGGNQGDMVKDSWLATSRLLALRWPVSWGWNKQRPLPHINAAGVIMSTNEA